MFKKWYTKLFATFSLIALLTACSALMKPNADQPKAVQPKKPLTAVEVLQKSDEAMKKMAKGYSFDLTGSYGLSVNIPDRLINNIEMPFDMVMETDSKGQICHMKGNMSLFGTKVPIHEYVDKTEKYEKVNGKWIKRTNSAQKEPMDGLERYLKISKEAPKALKMKEEKDMYVIEIDSKAFPENVKQKLLGEIWKGIGKGQFSEEPGDESAMKLVQYSEKLVIDKKSFVIQSGTVAAKLKFKNQRVKDKVMMEIKYDIKLNKMLDQPVIVPEYVKKNAKDFNKLSDREKEEIMRGIYRGSLRGSEEEMKL